MESGSQEPYLLAPPPYKTQVSSVQRQSNHSQSLFVWNLPDASSTCSLKARPETPFTQCVFSAPRIFLCIHHPCIRSWVEWLNDELSLGFGLLRAMGEIRLILDDDFSSNVFRETPRRSFALSFSPLVIIHGIFSIKSFSYDELPSEPLRLTVLKLDGSSFDIKVTRTATIAELKQAVETVFSHMPHKGPEKISWQHVWGQFCLCYDGQKLVTEKDHLRNYGIKDGDQLRFIRHVSSYSSMRKKRSKKRVVISKLHRLWRVRSYRRRKHGNDDDDGDDNDDIGLDGIDLEKGDIQHYINDEDGSGSHENRLTGSGFLGGLFSYTRQGIVRSARTDGRISPSRIARGLLGSFGMIRKIVFSCRRRRYPRRCTWREY